MLAWNFEKKNFEKCSPQMWTTLNQTTLKWRPRLPHLQYFGKRLPLLKILVTMSSLTDSRGVSSFRAYNYSHPMSTKQSILTWDEVMNALLQSHNAAPSLFSLLSHLLLSVSHSLWLGGGVQQLLWVVKEQLVCVWLCVCLCESHPSMTGISSPSIPELHTPCKPVVLFTNTLFCLFST